MNVCLLFNEKSHRHRQDDLRVTCQVSNVAVQGNVFFCSASFANSQRNTEDGVCTKFGYNKLKGLIKFMHLDY